ncbi:caspase family protein [Vibrio sp. SCSIO 43136]|uniref:caspase family protein n=1 Tax=Vibrio sp. SCSIO 43136 TaxID=2819101 RepID=UPI0020754D08|nr:caspase family protein [Vibrio sp. SCSIO 43136]USD67205.1 caspase family protein [Vibrio sp. SCSIO 43136]
MRALLAIFTLLFTLTTQATTYHALVVGVSEYPSLDPSLNLEGPKYDALRVKTMLQQQGVSSDNITLLADGVEGAPLPTRSNILAAFESITAKVNRGDFVYLHFSGHGSQQPNLSGGKEEGADGLDEIFLPRDIGQWSKKLGTVSNSLTDNQVNVLTTRLRNKGANVWVVFDSCHSGTMTRSLTGQEFRSRNVGLQALRSSKPAKSKALPVADTLAPVELASDAGALVSFGAAQSNEEAPEMLLPNGEVSSPQGLFTYTMTNLISQNPNITYRQLAQGILSSYNSMPWYRTMPLFEGGAQLDQPIFHREGEISERFALTEKKGRYTIQAGQLNGLGVGAVVEVFADIGSDEPVAVMEVTQSGLTTSQAELRDGALSHQADGNKAHYVSLLSPAVPEKIRFKWQKMPNEKWVTAMTQLLSDNEHLARTVEWVASDDVADISLYVTPQRLYFFTLTNQFLPCDLVASTSNEVCDDKQQEKYLSLSLERVPNADKTLHNGVSRVVRAYNLRRLAASMQGKSSIESDVSLNNESRGLEQVITAQDGDLLKVSFTNRGRNPVDLAVMFIDSGMGITQIFPDPGFSGRLSAGESEDFEGEMSSASTQGEEQFVVIAVPASKTAPQMSLSHLQQESLESSTFIRVGEEIATRGDGSYEDVFAQSLGDVAATRAFKKKEKSNGRAAISVIRLQTQ